MCSTAIPCKLSSHCVWKYQFGFNWCYSFLIADYEARGPYTFMFQLERNWKQQQSTRKSQYFNRTMTRQGRLCGLQATQRAWQVWGALTWGWGHTVRLSHNCCPAHPAQAVGQQMGAFQLRQNSCQLTRSPSSHPSTSVSTGLGQLNPLTQHSASSTKAKEPYRARELSWFIFNSLEIYRTFPSHLHRREKNRLAWRELFKAVTEPFLSITLLNRHPNGTAEMITGEVQWNCWNSSAQNQSLG